MKNKKKALLYTVVICLLIGACYGFTRYQQLCNITESISWKTNSEMVSRTFIFNKFDMCPGEYYLRVDKIEPESELNISTSLGDEKAASTFTKTKDQSIKVGDEIKIDKSKDSMYVFSQPEKKVVSVIVEVIKK